MFFLLASGWVLLLVMSVEMATLQSKVRPKTVEVHSSPIVAVALVSRLMTMSMDRGVFTSFRETYLSY